MSRQCRGLAFFIPNTVSLLSLVWSSPDAVGVGSDVIGGGGALGGKGGAIASVWGGGALKAFDDVCLCNLDSISSKNDIPFWLLCLGGFIDGETGEGLTLSSLDEPITSSCLSWVVYPVSPPTTNLSSLFFGSQQEMVRVPQVLRPRKNWMKIFWIDYWTLRACLS